MQRRGVFIFLTDSAIYNNARPMVGFPPERPRVTARAPIAARSPKQALYFFGGLIMMWAPAVPGDISHGAPSLALVDRPVDSGVAKGT